MNNWKVDLYLTETKIFSTSCLKVVITQSSVIHTHKMPSWVF